MASTPSDSSASNNMIVESIWSVFPTTLTILPTYRCNAACEQCCFESNPKLAHRLSLDEIKNLIGEAHSTFPALKVVVFSGGECFLLKSDLFESIRHATSLGLLTRCVTNGYWGKTERQASSTVDSLLEAGVTEINISTGVDHQKWVPFSSVENAARALVDKGINTLVTIEADGEDSECVKNAASSPTFKDLLLKAEGRFKLQQNIWMPFNGRFDPSRVQKSNESMYGGCDQLFSNMVATPHGRISACCGLTFEYIPELKTGYFREESLRTLAERQLDDALKLWLAVDGPATIMKRIGGPEIVEKLRDVNHICHACAIMYKSPELRDLIRQRLPELLPEIVSRFNLATMLRAGAPAQAKQAVPVAFA